MADRIVYGNENRGNGERKTLPATLTAKTSRPLRRKAAGTAGTLRHPSPSPATGHQQEAPVTISDFADRLHQHTTRLSSAIASTLDCHRVAAHADPERRTPLPQWAVERLEKAYKPELVNDYYATREMLTTALDLGSGAGCTQRFELWQPMPGDSRSFDRLDIGSESLIEARERLQRLGDEFPGAFVARVDVRSTGGGATDPALLDTLLGRLWLAGTIFPRNEAPLFQIQDATGRTVTVGADVLQAHPCFARLSQCSQAIVHSRSRSHMVRDPARCGEEVQ